VGFPTGRTFEDLSGQRFDFLMVLEATSERAAGSVVFLCRCDCGRTVKKSRSSLHQIAMSKWQNHCGCKGRGGKLPVKGVGFCSQGAAGPDPQSWVKSRRSLFAKLQRRTKARGLIWELTEDQFSYLTQGSCHYCGIRESSSYATGSCLPYKYNGIDRVDNKIGYVITNVVPCCGMCNMLKSTFGATEFIEQAQRIAEYQSNRQRPSQTGDGDSSE
jgi:hypothetical protein